MAANDALPLHPSPSSPPSTVALDDDHVHVARIFLGPMPQDVISNAYDDYDGDDGNEGTLGRFISEHSLAFFLRNGGRREDWGEAAERGVRDEMLKRWRQSEWARLHTRRGKKKQPERSRWVGESFEVGEIMGVNVLKEESIYRVSSRPSLLSKPSSFSAHAAEPAQTGPTTTATATETFVTAPSEFTSHPSHASADNGGSVMMDNHKFTPHHSDAPLLAPVDSNGDSVMTDNHRASATSSTPLLQETMHRHRSTGLPSPSLRPSLRGARSDDIMPSPSSTHFPGKGKGKAVRYADDHLPQSSSPNRTNPPPLLEEPEPDPAPPNEVLARTGDDVQGASAGATIEEQTPTPHDMGPTDSDVMLRGERNESSRVLTHTCTLILGR